MKIRKKHGALSVTAYRGDAKTLLAFDLDPAGRAGLAGFTVHIQPPGENGYYLWNDLTFERPQDHARVAGEPDYSTANAPIHKFRWVHVPGVNHQGLAPAFGDYVYTVTPRYFDAQKRLIALDGQTSLAVTIAVGPFAIGKLKIGFTRGFVQSQAYVRHFGSKAPSRPRGGPLNFDTSAVSGRNDAGQTYTYDQQYEWLGFSARDLIFEILDQVVADPSLTLDVCAYDLNEPGFVDRLLKLGREKRVRVLLDDATLHHTKNPTPGGPTKPEDQFQQMLNTAVGGAGRCLRGHFKRYAHDKVLIVRRGEAGPALRVLTGSTNFSITGVYVNSNHVMVFDDAGVAKLYARMFDTVWEQGADQGAFQVDPLANTQHPFAARADLPATEIAFSPHTADVSRRNLDAIVARIDEEAGGDRNHGNLFFAVMGLSGSAINPVYDALKAAHATLNVFSYGISDEQEGISFYPVGSTQGVLVTGKPASARLPKPFSQVPGIGLGHQIHHKFVVCGFNGPDPVVYCGSSNLAYLGEIENGDNLLAIRNDEVAACFVIEALALVDHFNFLGRVAAEAGQTAGQPQADRRAAAQAAQWYLGVTDTWAKKFFDPNDLHSRDRELFAS
ncbi:MAG: hypothetical protein J7515_16390 [Caulobacter sp.]|nr:hypothetical protein [Caulobacter sp.]